ncbi:MAG: tRNA (N6-isopentenyl adenosine(37)-C2)-methylthiotransferase MiaB [Sphingobacteriia bacterium]|nr:MAG: tRNA (N6-isopentenyl adenosine(37)-C2)-methylthiotransferase MiaB [Sphingobacteriia bacterium]
MESLAAIHDETRQGEAFLHPFPQRSAQKQVYLESYGCAMNFADSEVVASILANKGFGTCGTPELADLILVNTCSIREKAELTIRKRLTEFRKLKRAKPGLLIGILGCMAERLKAQLLTEEKLVDLVVGPDAYRSLPDLIEEAEGGQKGVNVLLSREETYGDVSPIRLNSNGIMAFVSITRGCNNMCSFCVVPFTRGRERSRDMPSILQEVRVLLDAGYKEVTLLGQNVDSYYWNDPETNQTVTFAQLLAATASTSPQLRVRFSTSHPKDITDEVLHTMARFPNICKCIHLPVQSGSSRILQLMNRTYTREWYLSKIDRIREILPDCSITTDLIAGFCTETDADHAESLSLMDYSGYDMSYMYFYSERPGTLAARRYTDDIPLETKKKRLQEIVDMQGVLSTRSNEKDMGKIFEVLIEGNSKKNDQEWTGRSSQNKSMVFPKTNRGEKPGDYVQVLAEDYTRATLLGKIVYPA